MNQVAGDKAHRGIFWLVFASAILLGLVLLVSGTGKLPGQTEFIDALLKSFWTPAVAFFIGTLLPWVEIALGALLILGIFPRIIATICLPLAVCFIANNIWAIANAAEFPHCAYCFGIWEEFFGVLSPLGALIIDIVLLGLALIIVLLHREGFLTFRPWFIKKK